MKFSKLIKCLSLGAIMSFSVNSFATANDIVVYFSASGNTKIVAQALAKKLDVQALAIEAKQVYTDDDLNYRKDNCRANVEMKTPDVRPEISNDLSAVNDKENVYLGFPFGGVLPLESYKPLLKAITLRARTFTCSAPQEEVQSISHYQI